MMSEHGRGTLYVVATPIGHLDDCSPRAQAVLKRVAVVAAEDTRHSAALFARFGIETRRLALHEHNEREATERVLERLARGEDVALISDAGTPLISDPGYRVVGAARAAGYAVSPVPGPSALIAALSVAGLPTDRFVFEGFLPAKPGARRERLDALVAEPRTLVFYEAKHRIVETLADLAAVFGGQRRAVLARELTKVHETVLDGTLEALHARVTADADQQLGEFVLVVAGSDTDEEARVLAAGERVLRLLLPELAPSRAVKLAAAISGAPRNALYALVEDRGA
jgi:16S rRNA (cytidine1402-2'-O)-methyltransferase